MAPYPPEAVAADPRIDELRRRMHVVENPQYSADYLDPDRRSVTNAVQARRGRTSGMWGVDSGRGARGLGLLNPEP